MNKIDKNKNMKISKTNKKNKKINKTNNKTKKINKTNKNKKINKNMIKRIIRTMKLT